MRLDNNKQAFLALLRAGLWEQDVQLLPLGKVDYPYLFKLAEEQSVVGLLAAGLEHIIDTKVPKDDALIFVGYVLQLEKRNSAMNVFVGDVIDRMRKADIYTLLVKGQGVAQCYERPLWRSCGDIDFLLSYSNYRRAKDFLVPLASSVEEEDQYECHLGMMIDPWPVEIHGNLRTGISNRIDKQLDEVQRDVFYGGNVRS